MSDHGWIGVDLDGTLALYPHSFPAIGPPIPAMVDRVRAWLNDGQDIRIFTARVGIRPELSSEHGNADADFAARQMGLIEAWCLEHLDQILPVTAQKDFHMIALWDDRCVQVVPNTGATVEEHWQAVVIAAREARDQIDREAEQLRVEIAVLRQARGTV